MQAKGTATYHAPCCQIIDIGSRGSRPAGNRRKGRLAGLDRKFKELDQNGRMHVVHNVDRIQQGYVGWDQGRKVPP